MLQPRVVVPLTVAVATGAVTLALLQPPASLAMWWSVAIPYLLLAGLSLYRMWDDGTFLDRLAPRFGDPSQGILAGVVLLAGAWVALRQLTPAGAVPHPWVVRVFVQLGPSAAVRGSLLLTGLILVTVVAEELVWRGMVLDALTEWIGARWAWIVTGLLYAVTVTPTIVLLAGGKAGPNPLALVAALGGGLLWSFQARMSGRLPPVMIAHGVFTYVVAALPALRPALLQ